MKTKPSETLPGDIEVQEACAGPIPSPGLDQLLPWQQLRLIQQAQPTCRANHTGFPLIKLRGNPNQLRAARAAEMKAWESI